MTSQVVVSAPGKIIISGEHAVVYGYPSLVSSIDKRVELRIKRSKKNYIYPAKVANFILRGLRKTEGFLNNKVGLEIGMESTIPVGRGMGSSAAIAVSLAAGISKIVSNKSNLKEINKLAFEIERLQHGNPSGVDNTVSTYGGFLWFRKETKDFKTFSKVKSGRKLNDIVLIDSGKPTENTKQMVNFVSEIYKKNPRKVERLFQSLEKLTRNFLRYLLNEEELSLRELIMENENYLENLGVVSESTKKLIRSIENLGGAAKITGAGGKKGNSGILIAYHPRPYVLLNFAKGNGITTLQVKLGRKGVKVEKE